MKERRNGEKTSTRRKRRTRGTRTRSIMVMLMWVRSGTPKMRAQAPKKKGWQTLPSKRLHRLLSSSPTSPMTRATTFLFVSWQKKVPTETSPSSNDDKDILIKEFGMKGYKVIKTLMKKLEK